MLNELPFAPDEAGFQPQEQQAQLPQAGQPAQPSLSDLLAASQAQSRGTSNVPEAVPSSPGYAPAGTPGSQPGEAPSQPQMNLSALLAASEKESQKAPSRGPMANLLAGANGRIIDAVHGAYWVAKRALKANLGANAAMVEGENLGDPEVQFKYGIIDPEGSWEKSNIVAKKWLHDNLGMISQGEEGSTMAHIGKNSVDAMATLGAFFAAAPSLAATQGTSTAAFIKRTLGESLVKHPWLATASELFGGVPGSTVGEEHFGPTGAILGGAVGQVTSGVAITGAVNRSAGLSKAILTKVADAVDTIASKLGASDEMLNASKMFGQKLKMPIVSDDIIDGYRTAEARARSAGEAVVQAAAEYRAIKDAVTLPEKVEAARKVWLLRKDEQAAADAAEKAWLKIPEPLRSKYSQEATAIRNEFADTVYPKQFAEVQIAGERQVVEDKIKDALTSVKPTDDKRTAAQIAVSISKKLIAAEDIATQAESKAWKRVNILKEKMPERAGPLNDLDDYMRNAKSISHPDDVPDEAVKGFRKLFASQGNEPGIFQALPTVKRLRAEIGNLDRLRRENLAADAPSFPLNANLTRLEALANKWIGDAFPDNIPLQQARAFSNMKHDLFNRSEMFPFLRSGVRGQDVVRPEDTITQLLKRQNGMKDIYAVSDRLLKAKRFYIKGEADEEAFTLPQREALKALRTDVENGIRQTFHEEVQNMYSHAASQGKPADPMAIDRIVTAWTPRIKEFSKVASEMQDAMGKAFAGLQQRRAIEKSALVKYMESNDAETAINRVWSSPNAAAMAKALISGEAGIGGFRNDPVALEGFRSALVDKLFRAADNQPIKVEQMLREGRISRLMQTSLGSDRMDRLEAVVSQAIKIQRDGTDTQWAKNVIWGARLAAVKISALVPQIGNGGQLQQAALFSEIAKRQVIRMMSGGDPVTLMSEAVRNPSMERLLFSKVPKDATEAKANLVLMRRVLRFDVGVRGAVESVMHSDDAAPGPRAHYPSLSDMLSAGKAMAADNPSQQVMPGNAPPAQDPFKTKIQGKDQDRAPAGNLPEIGKPKSNPFKVSSLTGAPPSENDDYHTGVHAILNDAKRERIQGPANNPFIIRDEGTTINPGRDYIPGNRGPFQPWNARV